MRRTSVVAPLREEPASIVGSRSSEACVRTKSFFHRAPTAHSSSRAMPHACDSTLYS